MVSALKRNTNKTIIGEERLIIGHVVNLPVTRANTNYRTGKAKGSLIAM